MKYIIVDGMLSGTGIRDPLNGGYIDLDDLPISTSLKKQIEEWVQRYENAHYGEFKDLALVDKLDEDGLNICQVLISELPESKVEYYSDAKMIKVRIE